jgi:DNA repair protein RecO (recombination protein O)
MKQLLTTGMVLTRTDYGEADRIVTLLTPDYGKLRLLARGVRKVKSKLAGGIELFSVSEIGFVQGRGEIGTLVSARLITHYGRIIQDIERVQQGYALIKLLHRATEDRTEPEYFELLQQAFAALNDPAISLELIGLWFRAQLLRLAGHTPNLRTDNAGQELTADQLYLFDFDHVAFRPHEAGQSTAAHIKVLRLLCSDNPLQTIARVQGATELLPDVAPLLTTMTTSYLRT